MEIIKDDIWGYRVCGYVVIPTNGTVTRAGQAVMGRGLAQQMAKRYPDFPRLLAQHLLTDGNTLKVWPQYSVITFPVKHNWQYNADLRLIEESAKALGDYLTAQVDNPYGLAVYCPKVGCGNGRLCWENVEPILKKYCPQITIVDNGAK